MRDCRVTTDNRHADPTVPPPAIPPGKTDFVTNSESLATDGLTSETDKRLFQSPQAVRRGEPPLAGRDVREQPEIHGLAPRAKNGYIYALPNPPKLVDPSGPVVEFVPCPPCPRYENSVRGYNSTGANIVENKEYVNPFVAVRNKVAALKAHLREENMKEFRLRQSEAFQESKKLLDGERKQSVRVEISPKLAG